MIAAGTSEMPRHFRKPSFACSQADALPRSAQKGSRETEPKPAAVVCRASASIELRHLRYFVVVAEELHFSRAATRLRMSQPPLSQQIKQLEAAIGTSLFARTKRSVTLTSAGRDLYEHLRPWMMELDEMFARTLAIGEGERGHLSVGCSFTTSQRLVPAAIRRFSERFPSVTVKLQEAPFLEQVEAVLRGFVDVAVIRLPVSHPELEAIELYEEPLVVAVPAGHPLADVPQLRLRDLKHEVLLNASGRPVGIFDSVRALCEHAGISPAILDISSTANSAIALVGTGMGIALVPEGVRHGGQTNVVYRTLVDSPRSRVGVVHRRTNASPATRLFIDVAIEVATTTGTPPYAREERT